MTRQEPSSVKAHGDYEEKQGSYRFGLGGGGGIVSRTARTSHTEETSRFHSSIDRCAKSMPVTYGGLFLMKDWKETMGRGKTAFEPASAGR